MSAASWRSFASAQGRLFTQVKSARSRPRTQERMPSRARTRTNRYTKYAQALGGPRLTRSKWRPIQRQMGLLSVGDVVARVPVTRETVYNMVKRGELPGVRFGGRVFIDAQGFERYLAQNRTGDGSAAAATAAQDDESVSKWAQALVSPKPWQGKKLSEVQSEDVDDALFGPEPEAEDPRPPDIWRPSGPKRTSETSPPPKPRRSFADDLDLTDITDEAERAFALKRRRLRKEREAEERAKSRSNRPHEEVF